ncbi:hypothetical protein [Providencia hangzhouensis]
MAQQVQEYRCNGNTQGLPDGTMACRTANEGDGAGELSAACSPV